MLDEIRKEIRDATVAYMPNERAHKIRFRVMVLWLVALTLIDAVLAVVVLR